MDEATKILLSVLGVYFFIVLGVYFVGRIIWNNDEDFTALGYAVAWPFIVFIGAICLPFWVVGKAADYVHDHIRWEDKK